MLDKNSTTGIPNSDPNWGPMKVDTAICIASNGKSAAILPEKNQVKSKLSLSCGQIRTHWYRRNCWNKAPRGTTADSRRNHRSFQWLFSNHIILLEGDEVIAFWKCSMLKNTWCSHCIPNLLKPTPFKRFGSCGVCVNTQLFRTTDAIVSQGITTSFNTHRVSLDPNPLSIRYHHVPHVSMYIPCKWSVLRQIHVIILWMSHHIRIISSYSHCI